ncbi:MAG: hypothetical protein LBU73_00920, partial [Helicobacteraceae bacterium]|nr:hypothetical protein [Helicobacteraceae bacterium]
MSEIAFVFNFSARKDVEIFGRAIAAKSSFARSEQIRTDQNRSDRIGTDQNRSEQNSIGSEQT